MQSSKFAFGYIFTVGLLLLALVGLYSFPNPYSNWLSDKGIFFYSVQMDSLLSTEKSLEVLETEQEKIQQKSQKINLDTPHGINIELEKQASYSQENPVSNVDISSLNLSEKQRFDSLSATHKYLYLNPESESLTAFFERLNQSKKKGVRIWYYGDSQIEGDRITSEIRKSLQSYFGGSGIGFLPLSNPASYQLLELSDQSDWQKFNCFQHKKKKVDFGPSGLVFIPKDKNPQKWNTIRLKISKSLKYQHPYLVCPSDTLFQVEWKSKKDSVWRPVKKIINQNQINLYALGDSVLHDQITIRCKGSNLRVYGLSLEGDDRGIQLDNFGIRGHSGDGLKSIASGLLSGVTAVNGTGLIVFHFGNNMIPYLKTDPRSEKWAKDIFRSIFRKYKSSCPNASMLVIGPGDMGFHRSGEAAAYGSCPILNKWMKDVSIEEGLSYFDFYQFIVDKGGILSWRSSNLASLDGHLTPSGQRLFGKEFSKELISAYEAYHIISKR